MTDFVVSAITVAITGASGAKYGVKLVEELLRLDKKVYLIVSDQGQELLKTETDIILPTDKSSDKDKSTAQEYIESYFSAERNSIKLLFNDDWQSCVASGSAAPEAMVICPCSMSTLSAVASGLSDNLIRRAADVVLKERGRLVLVPRETPLSMIHLENMLKVTRAGGIILPPSPGFYSRPETIDELIDFVVARIIKSVGLESSRLKKWGEE